MENDGNIVAAAAATSSEQLAPDYKDAFRQAVADALRRVFDLGEAEVQERVETYFADGERSLSFYHRNPLQIATDLSPAADRELSDEESRRYVDMAQGPTDHYGLPRGLRADDSETLPIRAAW